MDRMHPSKDQVAAFWSWRTEVQFPKVQLTVPLWNFSQGTYHLSPQLQLSQSLIHRIPIFTTSEKLSSEHMTESRIQWLNRPNGLFIFGLSYTKNHAYNTNILLYFHGYISFFFPINNTPLKIGILYPIKALTPPQVSI